jgi:glycosyltransferase involved in cell wall biosynthesis
LVARERLGKLQIHDSKRTSVIVPTYNRKNFLQSSLNAILAQTDARDEVIVVVDGSSDGTECLLQTYEGRIHTIHQKNVGKAKALNAALAIATGQFVWVVDDDDIVCPTAHLDLLALFDGKPDVMIAYGRHRRFRQEADGTKILLDTGYWNDCRADELFLATLEDFFVHQPGMLVRRSLYRVVGDFDESLPRSIDYDMLIRLARHGKAASTNKVIFHQRQHDGDRGPAKKRFKIRDRDANWVLNDAHIITRLHESLPLEAYLPANEIRTAQDRRQALLQRGTIMARKKRWPLALLDFRTALDEFVEPLSLTEKQILRRATGSKYGCAEIISNPEIDVGLAVLRLTGPHGVEVCRSLARGLVWRIRECLIRGDLKGASQIARQAYRWASGKGGQDKQLSAVRRF